MNKAFDIDCLDAYNWDEWSWIWDHYIFPFMSHFADYVYKSKWTVNGYEIYIYVAYIFNLCGIIKKIDEIKNFYRIEKKYTFVINLHTNLLRENYVT